MKKSIGKQILIFRKAKKASQAELADFLGIQSQTVSKWEREVCVPDIARLPQIAAFFGITLDELFGINQESTFQNSLAETENLIFQRKWKEAAKKSACLAVEFPMHKCFTENLLITLSQALLCGEHFPQKFISEAVALGKRAVQETSSPKQKNNIIYHLCKLLYILKRSEEADFYAEMLPDAQMCRETLDMYKCSGDKLISLSNENISLYYMLIGNSFSNIAENAGERETAEYLKKAISCYEEAHLYNNNERCIRNALLSKLRLAEVYYQTGENSKADEIIIEAESYAKNFSLYELYLKYTDSIIKKSK